VMPTTLIYVAGGLALAEFKFRENSGPIQNKELLAGWTIGAGVDQAFTKNLIGRVEFLYADYGHKDFVVAPGDIYNIGFKAQTVRGALMWKFCRRRIVREPHFLFEASKPSNGFPTQRP